jgi:hypothetical protein
MINSSHTIADFWDLDEIWYRCLIKITPLLDCCNESPKVVTLPKVATPIGNDNHTLRFSKSRIARSWMPPKTGPVPRELLEPALYSSGMTAQNSRALLRSCEWQALTSRNSQVVFLSEFGETDTASRLTTDDIAMIFNICADNLRQIRHRARMKTGTTQTSCT